MLNNRSFGILKIEYYFPKLFISQETFEKSFNYSKGRITKGLGQLKMSVANYNEDCASMCLTVLNKLLKTTNINENEIGHLQVGTETLNDKSKSVKTILMNLFKNNKDMEGVTSINACYGGTAALFNALAWLESSQYDGRYAIVIMSDIALYKNNNAIPSGGAGAIALLLGENNNKINSNIITLDKLRASYFDDQYDFYKPNLEEEYPVVNGKLSLDCYFKSMDECYSLLKHKHKIHNNKDISINSFSGILFHCPFTRQVEKSFLRLAHNEIISLNNNNLNYSEYNEVRLKEIINDELNNKLYPGLLLSKVIGNIYTGSLYLCLISHLINSKITDNNNILLFSYGSGLASTMFTLSIPKDFNYDNLLNINNELNNRTEITYDDFLDIIKKREFIHNSLNFGKKLYSFNVNNYYKDTYYLKDIDKYGKRYYDKIENKLLSNIKINNSSNFELKLNTLSNNLTNISNQNNKLYFNNFHKKSLNERIQLLVNYNHEVEPITLKHGGLPLEIANQTIENCIGKLSLPLGLATNFLINGNYYNVPMVVEEPSIVAAASSIAKFISDYGGFEATASKSILIGQLQCINIDNYEKIIQLFEKNKTIILERANKYCFNLVKRGGGVLDIKYKSIKESKMFIILFYVDTCEAMGANMVNTLLENISYDISLLLDCKILLKILSNSCPERLATSRFKIPIDKMDYKTLKGSEICDFIIKATELANNDTYRASTHNKGIMNGVGAVAVALGQDWRAIEACVHSYFPNQGMNYKSLTKYYISENGLDFIGEIEIPLMIGTKGGALTTNLQYVNNFKILGNPNSFDLMKIMASVGLAQNFAALRALVSEGIQKGHMKLHGRRVAITAGLPSEIIEECINYLMNNNMEINIENCKDYYLKKLN